MTCNSTNDSVGCSSSTCCLGAGLWVLELSIELFFLLSHNLQLYGCKCFQFSIQPCSQCAAPGPPSCRGGREGASSIRVLALDPTHPLPVYTNKFLLEEDCLACVLIAHGAFQTQGDIREWRKLHAHKSPIVTASAWKKFAKSCSRHFGQNPNSTWHRR